MYIVVFRTKVGVSEGAITWTTFTDQATFNVWNDEEMSSWYEVVEEGVSKERALELCSSPEAKYAREVCNLRELTDALSKVTGALR
jgi:hypothetical protein